MRTDYEFPEGQRFTSKSPSLAVSPDGKQFVYCTPKGLYLRSMNELGASLLDGTEENPGQPFFSPDSQWIGYCAQTEGKLKKVSISGGSPTDICDVNIVLGASWNSDNTIVYSDLLGGIKRISSDGGAPKVLIKADVADLHKDGFPAAPQMLPDGETLLFTSITDIVVTNNADFQTMIQSLESGNRRVLFKGGVGATYLPTGHIIYLYTNNDTIDLLAVPFDLDSLKITGGAIPLVNNVSLSASVSNTGTLVYIQGVSAGAEPVRSLVWVDRDGNEESLSAKAKDYRSPRVSPDGTKVALSYSTSGNRDIWIWDIVREIPERLTHDEAEDYYPLWTPDSEQIVFYSLRETGFSGFYLKSANGTGKVERLDSTSGLPFIPWSWSSDKKTLVGMPYIVGGPTGGNYNIATMSIEGDRERKTLLNENYQELQPKISPNGKWMAYASNESGKFEIIVRPFPDVDTNRWTVSTDGGTSPLWSPDGQELFYRNGDSVMAVPVESESRFSAGKPEVLFKDIYVGAWGEDMHPWDIRLQDGRFLMMKAAPSTEEPTAPPAPPKINIVTNWFEELKEKVPVE
jgi:Tol biopolymer transport system component